MASRILITGSIKPELFDTIVRDTQGYFTGEFGPNDEPLLIFIASQGGDTRTSHNIYVYLRTMPVPIITYAAGAAESAATIIFCAGDERVMTQHSSLYVHEPAFALHNVGAHELKQQVKNLRCLSKRDIDILQEVTGQDRAVIRDWHLHGRHFNAKEALKAGLATQIVKTAKLRDPRWQLLV